MSIKTERIGSNFVKEISYILMEEIKDPNIKFVTITSCDVTNDLSYAKVYFTVLDDSKKEVTVDGKNIKLTPTEYNILKFLTKNKGKVFSISQIYENVWEEEYDPEFDTNSVKTAKALHNEYKRIAYEKNTNIISAADYVQPSETDQEHLTAQGHEILANAIFNAVVSASIV